MHIGEPAMSTVHISESQFAARDTTSCIAVLSGAAYAS